MKPFHILIIFILSLCTFGAIIELATFTDTGIYILLFGTPTAYIINLIIPDSFLYWLVPEGGGPMAALIFIISALIQTIIIITIIYYFWLKRSKPANKSDTLIP